MSLSTPLPDGWVQFQRLGGKGKYYRNTRTGCTQSERPLLSGELQSEAALKTIMGSAPTADERAAREQARLAEAERIAALFDKGLGEACRRARRNVFMTPKDVAERLGMPLKEVRSIEAGLLCPEHRVIDELETCFELPEGSLPRPHPGRTTVQLKDPFYRSKLAAERRRADRIRREAEAAEAEAAAKLAALAERQRRYDEEVAEAERAKAEAAALALKLMGGATDLVAEQAAEAEAARRAAERQAALEARLAREERARAARAKKQVQSDALLREHGELIARQKTLLARLRKLKEQHESARDKRLAAEKAWAKERLRQRSVLSGLCRAAYSAIDDEAVDDETGKSPRPVAGGLVRAVVPNERDKEALSGAVPPPPDPGRAPWVPSAEARTSLFDRVESEAQRACLILGSAQPLCDAVAGMKAGEVEV
jgi:hypothetical protein